MASANPPRRARATTQRDTAGAATTARSRVVAALAAILVLAGGVFLVGHLAADMTIAMILTAAWFGAAFVAGLVLTRRRRDLLLPLGAAFASVALAAALLVALPTVRDREVNERVITAAPEQSAQRGSEKQAAPVRQGGNVLLAQGPFRSIEHPSMGTVKVIAPPSGERKLTLTHFETDSGPDLRVYLSTVDPAASGELGDFEDLGALKGNKGTQQYEVPRGVDIERYSTVVVWCRAFSVPFASAVLTRS